MEHQEVNQFHNLSAGGVHVWGGVGTVFVPKCGSTDY